LKNGTDSGFSQYEDDITTDAGRVAELFAQLGLSDLDRMIIGDLLRHAPEPGDIGLTAMLGLMFAALGEGSLCLPLDPGMLMAGGFKFADPSIGKRVSRCMERIDRGYYDALIDRDARGAFKPLVIDAATGRRLLYFQKFHYHEQRLKQRLKLFLSADHGPQRSSRTVERTIEELYGDRSVIRKKKGGDPIVRDPFQIEAIRGALTVSLLVISGGPGTGKTSLLVNILRALVRTGTDSARIMLAAPTGRAAQRMTEALQANLETIEQPDAVDLSLRRISASTLHKMLMYRGRDGGFIYNERRSIPADTIAVDEVSMVDVAMMDRFFQAVDPKRTTVILIGDKDQLPSVEAGSVLADISASTGGTLADHFVVLDNVYRSEGKLLDLARDINAGHAVHLNPVGFEEALTQKAGNWSFVAAGDEGRMIWPLERWVSRQYIRPPGDGRAGYADLVKQFSHWSDPAGDTSGIDRQTLVERLLADAYRCRILTVLRGGPFGMRQINDRIAMQLRPILDGSRLGENRLFNGALIMITRNDYQRELFNGDVGVVLSEPDGTYRAWFKRPNGIVAFPASGLSDWDFSFAMTVHKSQGSEFEDTLLVLPDDPEHRLLTREILYTATTRAAKRLIVYGSVSAFQTALQRKIRRYSGLTVE
jgi:exodeoxyribonuclease V alpha subunit